MKLINDVFLNKKELKIFTHKRIKTKILMGLDALYQVQ